MEDIGTLSAAAVTPVCNELKKKRSRRRKKAKVVITEFENQHAQEGWSDAGRDWSYTWVVRGTWCQ